MAEPARAPHPLALASPSRRARCQVVELAKEVAVLKTVLEVERDYTARLRTRLGLGKQAAA
jgi:hypothetical protein